MSVLDQIQSLFEKIGYVAEGMRRKLGYFLLLGLAASIYTASVVYSAESFLWWNVIKCLIVMLPSLVLLCIWIILGQVRQAPEVASNLLDDRDEILQGFTELEVSNVTSLTGAYGALKTLRQQEGLEDVMEAISGVGILINPLFALLAVLSFIGLLTLLIWAPILMVVL